MVTAATSSLENPSLTSKLYSSLELSPSSAFNGVAAAAAASTCLGLYTFTSLFPPSRTGTDRHGDRDMVRLKRRNQRFDLPSFACPCSPCRLRGVCGVRPVQHIFFDIGVLGVLGVLGVRAGRPGWWCRPTQQMHAAGLDDPRLATPSLCGFLCCVLMQQMGLVRAMA